VYTLTGWNWMVFGHAALGVANMGKVVEQRCRPHCHRDLDDMRSFLGLGISLIACVVMPFVEPQVVVEDRI
jgi:hypothetical protein